MRLYISDDKDTEAQLNVERIGIEEFNDIMVHPYISSKSWEAIIIDLDDRIHSGYISQIVKSRNFIIVPRIIRQVTKKQVLILTEIYPDMMTALVKAYAQGLEQFNELLNNLKVQYKWETIY